MPRHARVVPPNCPIHVTHRGNRREPIFLEPGGYVRYLRLLREGADLFGLEVWAYCLMPNHIHLIAVASEPISLAKTIQRVHGQYARWVHFRQGWSGHLWANRYYSVPMDVVHLWAAVRYVERNPVRSGLVRKAEDYTWSSARAHVFGERDSLLAAKRPFPGDVSDWRGWLASPEEDLAVEAIRTRTMAGLPLGDPEFVACLEQQIGRKLTAAPRGRPDTGTR
jgi:putative transposase